MQAIEFTSTIKDGVISLPQEYLVHENKQARVIVLLKPTKILRPQKQRLADIFARMHQRTMFRKIADPVAWQKQLRDEWE